MDTIDVFCSECHSALPIHQLRTGEKNLKVIVQPCVTCMLKAKQETQLIERAMVKNHWDAILATGGQ